MTLRIGIDLGGTKTEAVLLTQAGHEIARKRVSTPRGDYSGTIDGIVNLVQEMESHTPTPCSVGVATPGSLSPTSGLIRNSNSTWLNGRTLGLDLEMALKRPVRVANDANCFALSEAVDGVATNAAIVFGVILGTGVGGGLVVEKRVLLGKNSVAGEWGHNPFPFRDGGGMCGTECFCGRRGCIETFLSGSALVSAHQRIGGTLTSAKAIAAARNEDAQAESAITSYVDHLARALAQVINILDPDMIVLGGGLSNIETLYDEVPRLWDPYIFSDQVHTELRRNRHGDSSGVRGAARLWNSED